MTSDVIHPLDLEPTYVDSQTYVTRRRRTMLDMCLLLNFMLLTLFLLPAQLAIPQLTAIGRPALMVGLAVTVAWAVSKAHPGLVMRGPQPMRWAVLVFLVSILMSYAAGYLRGMLTLEANSADRTLIGMVIFLGIILACADSVPNRARLDDVIRMLVWCATAMALIGHVQSLLDVDITQYMTLPGLRLATELEGLEARGAGFFRVASTAVHYIEFSVVMAMVLPFALHVARFGPTRAIRRNAGLATLVIAAAVPITLSRTGILALVVGGLVMINFWPWRVLANVVGTGIGLIAVMVVVKPGLLGTIRSLFLNMSSDPSIQGRTEDYSVVSQYIAERPLLGRGYGTFIPKLYIILDNQWLHQIIGGGYFGLLALIGLHLTAIGLAIVAVRNSPREEDRHLAGCLIALQFIAMTAHATFDSFAFSTFTTVLALGTGMAAALWRLTHPNRYVRSYGPNLLAPI